MRQSGRQFKLIAQLVVLAASTAATVGQTPQGEAQRPITETTQIVARQGANNSAEPIEPPFLDDFSGATLDRAKWTRVERCALTETQAKTPDTDRAVVLRGSGHGAARQAELRSAPVRLSGLPGARVSFRARRRAGGGGLRIEYVTRDLHWKLLQRIERGGREPTAYAQALPADALHESFRIRFRTESAGRRAVWVLDDVRVESDRFDLTITTSAPTAIDVVLAARGDGATQTARTPALRAFESGTAVTLTAPEKAGNLIFRAWRLNGQSQKGDRRVAIEMTAEVSAVADYVPVFTLSVGATTAWPVPIDVLPMDRLGLARGSAPFTRSFAGGTRVVLAAPAEFDQRPFDRWIVNGRPRAQGQFVIDLEISGPTIATAHYSATPGMPATLTVDSTPTAGVLIRLASESEPADQTSNETPFQLVATVGQTVAVVAPRRTERLVFLRWVVNGVARPDDQAEMTLAVDGDARLFAEYAFLGDMNGDDLLNESDVEAFIIALSDAELYARHFPGLDPLRRGDTNDDGSLDNFDIDSFVDLILPPK